MRGATLAGKDIRKQRATSPRFVHVLQLLFMSSMRITCVSSDVFVEARCEVYECEGQIMSAGGRNVNSVDVTCSASDVRAACDDYEDPLTVFSLLF